MISVESYVTYFQSSNMRILQYASGMKEGVCVYKILVMKLHGFTVESEIPVILFSLTKMTVSIVTFYVSVFCLCQKFAMAG
jgi:hypothetical protein